MEPIANNTLFKSAVRVALATAFILLLPFLAMQFTAEVVWDLADFVVAGGLLFGAGMTFQLLARRATGNTAYRAATGIAVVAALVLVWVNLAVGIIGSEDNLANLMYFGVLAVGVGGAIVARFQPRGMALAILAMALVQSLITAIALIPGLRYLGGKPPEILLMNGVFIVLFAGSAWLFWRSAQLRHGQGGS